MIRTADGAEVVIVAAVAEKIGDGFLEDDGGAEGVGEFQAADALKVAAGGAPADAEGRGEGFAEGAAEEDTAVGVPGLEGLGAAFAEMEVAVDVVLDGGDVELGEDLVEFFFVLVGHAGAEGIRVTGHDQEGLDVVVREGVAGGVEADAGAGSGGDFDDLEVEGLKGFEETEVGGRLDCDGVTRFGDGTEGEVEGFGAADGDDEFIVGDRAAGLQVAAGDLAGERGSKAQFMA